MGRPCFLMNGSASTTRSLSGVAPWLPPMTSSVGRAGSSPSAAAALALSCRRTRPATGLPVTRALARQRKNGTDSSHWQATSLATI